MRISFCCAMAAFVILTASQPALAIDKIYSPNVTKGEFEVEYSGSTTFDHNHDKDNKQAHEGELEYGVTDWLQLELEGSLQKEPDGHLTSDAVEFGGRFQFFDQGENWIDTGMLLTYGHATHNDDPNTIEAKLLLETETGPFLHRANVGIEQEVGDHSQGGPDRVVLWNSRYRFDRHFEPGFEIQSDFGKGSDHLQFKDQEHYIGPAAFGEIIPNLKYEVAYYVGLTDAASHGAARLLLEYEMFF